MNWLFRAALRLVPWSWREAVRADLEEEIGAGRHAGSAAHVWCALQVVGIAIRLRWTVHTDALASDVRYAVRGLIRSRSFTAGAVLTGALGIGINVAVFSAVDRMVFRKLPYANSDELVQLRVCGHDGDCSGAFPSLIVSEGRTRLRTLGPMAVAGFPIAFATSSMPTDDPPLTFHEVSPGLLRVLGVRPMLGRDAREDEAWAGARLAWLSHETWSGRFGGDANILGRQVWNRGTPASIVGILPEGFVPPTWTSQDPAWDGLVLADDSGWASAAGPSVLAPLARLTPGESLGAARAEVDALVAALAPQLRQRDGTAPRIHVDRLESVLYDRFLSYAWLIVLAGGLLLAMACMNVSGLLLVRQRSREHETAVRIAIGGSSARVMFASLVESLAVCSLAVAGALLALTWTSSLIAASLPPLFGRYMATPGDSRVVAFAVFAAVGCAITAGVAPALLAGRTDVNATLTRAVHRGGRRSLRGGRSLVTIQSAVGVALVLAAALFVRSFTMLTGELLGFTPDHVYLVRGAVAGAPQPALTQYEEMLHVLGSAPGIVSVGGGDSVLGSGMAPMRGFSTDRSLRGGRYEVSSGYFRTLGSDLVAGREFSESEVRQRLPVAILSVSGANQMFPQMPPRDVIGRTLSLVGESPRIVVGVAKDVRSRAGAEPQPAIYVPLGAQPRRYGDVLIRLSPDARLSTAELRGWLRNALSAPRLTVAYLPDLLEPELRDPRFRAILLGILAVAGLLLAAAGLYAISALQMALRRHEIGIRLSLGSSKLQIHALVIGEALRPVLLGLAIGLLFAWWMSSAFAALLHGVDPHHPSAYVAAAILLLVSALLAAWLPARRAAATDPAVVLSAQ